jgi:Flp pilus assembly protein TadB
VEGSIVIGSPEWLALAGLGTGTGATLLLLGLFAVRPRLAAQHAQGAQGASALPAARRMKLGTAILQAFSRVSTRSTGSSADLAIIGKSAGAHAAEVGTAAIAGAALFPVLTAIATVLGYSVPLELPLAGCVLTGAVAALAPVIELHRNAAAARRRFRQALALWLELVALAQAAGMGLESALQSASSICGDQSFERIRLAVERARHAGRTPWAGLRQLGEELAIPDLVELGATLSLAGIEGARIRGSLSARAVALRQKELSDAEAEANATTERLFLPSIVLMLGFLIFVGYPAVITLLHTI